MTSWNGTIFNPLFQDLSKNPSHIFSNFLVLSSRVTDLLEIFLEKALNLMIILIINWRGSVEPRQSLVYVGRQFETNDSYGCSLLAEGREAIQRWLKHVNCCYFFKRSLFNLPITFKLWKMLLRSSHSLKWHLQIAPFVQLPVRDSIILFWLINPLVFLL